MELINPALFFKKTILIIGFFLASSPLYAQNKVKTKSSFSAELTMPKKLAIPKSVPAIIEAFFKKYKDQGIAPSIDFLFSTNKLFTDTAQISVLKQKLTGLEKSVGHYLGKDLIVQKNAGRALYFYSYLVKFENQPIRFTFMFYKPKNEWVLYHFKFDADLDTELEQAGKIK